MGFFAPVADGLFKKDDHKGSYAGEIANGGHIIPRSVCSASDTSLYNLETMQRTFNQKESAKTGYREKQLS